MPRLKKGKSPFTKKTGPRDHEESRGAVFWSVISFCNFWDTYDLKSIFWNKNDEIIKSVLLYTKVWSDNAPLLLAPVETCRGLAGGPLDPAMGFRPPALELKVIYTLILS